MKLSPKERVVSRAILLAIFVFVGLLVTASQSAAFTSDEVQEAGQGHSEAVDDLYAALQDPALTPAEAQAVLVATRDSAQEARRRTAALEPDDRPQRRYQEILLEGLDGQMALLDDTLAGNVDGQQFALRWNELNTSLQTDIAALNVEDSGGGSPLAFMDDWPFPLSELWFWLLIFLTPIVPISLMIIYGAGAGVSGLFRWITGRRRPGD